MWIRYVTHQVLTAVPNLLRAIPLMIANRCSTRRIPATSPDAVVVSLTSHGSRLRHLYMTVESVARGNQRAPIVLWLDRKDFERPWPASLRRLVRRGLQVRCSDGEYGPHTKYWNTFRQVDGTGTRVVTVDDDMIYPEWFLERLLFLSQVRGDSVLAYRAHRITFSRDGLAPYRKWEPCTSQVPSVCHFATGVSGVLYPATFVSYVVAQGERFMELTPRADDVWLHACALRSGHRVRQVHSRPRNFAVNPPAQREALVRSNTMGGGNDAQIAQVYTREDIAALRASATESAAS
ncbi:hypothetical protein [Corynebacterium uterequi]|uniref:Glycosyltransferase n=1 Tax=Corynebacterium uterequi TaxID=1072256 RepID=A0A0G3HGN8_9CORY|nr:hypothetical protein [Corynebacterium uterequi]AKK10292.1 hypothetical protein CUTER_01360 [Corynebacterium uterequi]